ncbi:MAG TPA: hypothetical protein VF255_00410 [Solirubrobacterales bacterium]
MDRVLLALLEINAQNFCEALGKARAVCAAINKRSDWELSTVSRLEKNLNRWMKGGPVP